MYNKLYFNIKKIVKNNFYFFMALVFSFALVNFKLPYYILAPGDISDVSTRIEIENHPIKPDAFNLTYLYEFRATVPTLIYSKLNKNWDIYTKKEIEVPNEKPKDSSYRDRLLLKEANQNAIIVAYNNALKEYKITNEKIIVSYIDEQAKTDLTIGDEIISINNKKVTDFNDLLEIIQSHKVGDVVYFQVENKNKTSNKTATMIQVDDKPIVGIVISLDRTLDTNPKLKLKFDENESGPSGGLMMSLAIYDALTDYSISSDLKIAGTGTIDEEGNVGPIGGIEYKIKGAVKNKVKTFLSPKGQNYEEAIKIKNENNYDIKIVPIGTFEDAINYFQKIK